MTTQDLTRTRKAQEPTGTRKPHDREAALKKLGALLVRDGKIWLPIDEARPAETVDMLRDILAQHGELYDNGAWVLVRIRTGRYGKFAQLATKSIIVRETHKICQPYVPGEAGPEPVKLPAEAQQYLEHENLGLRPLNGIVTTPLLQEDGTI